MKISYSWLKEFIDIEQSPVELGKMLTNTGLEVESIDSYEEIKGGLNGLLIGEVLTCDPHPNADRLRLTTVDVGGENPLSIVCGAPNVAQGQKVVVATVGTALTTNTHETFTIKRSKIRGELSEGMICAEDEIGIGEDHSGIIVLDTDLPNGSPAVKYFEPFEDHVFEIGLTPNRSDATSHLGTARDIRAVTGRQIKLPDIDHFSIDNRDLEIEVSVENNEACPRYSGITISGINIQESPKWLKNRLKSIGLSPINNVVDITNFVLHELGQPLHAFDADKITGKKVIVRTMEEGSPFMTLDAEERKLHANDLMICNSEEGMCIAGVFGGIKSGVTLNTKNIFLESAYFSPDYIRRTSQAHDLKTDASFRFERGTDPEMTVFALKRAAMLIRELAGGTISSDIVDVYPEPLSPFKVKVRYQNIDRLIGKSIHREQIRKILHLLDIGINHETEEGFEAEVPQYRSDVQREADIIEEILRIYGYDSIEISENISSDYLADFPQKDKDKIQQKLSELLASNGFNEIQTNSLTTSRYIDQLPAAATGENVSILNTVSDDLNVLRQHLIFTGLEVLSYNNSHRQKDLKIFEVGRCYTKAKGKYLEYNQLNFFMTGNVRPESWISASRKVEFHDLYEVIQKIFSKFNIGDINVDFFQDDLFNEGLSLSKNSKNLAKLGWLSKKPLKLFDLKQDVLYGVVDWDFFVDLANSDITFEPVSKFPEVRRDLSLVIDKSVSFRDILKLASGQRNQLVKRINVFDFYEGDKIKSNEKAYAMSFTLQDKTKTLNDKTIDKTMNEMMKLFEDKLGAKIRK